MLKSEIQTLNIYEAFDGLLCVGYGGCIFIAGCLLWWFCGIGIQSFQ